MLSLRKNTPEEEEDSVDIPKQSNIPVEGIPATQEQKLLVRRDTLITPKIQTQLECAHAPENQSSNQMESLRVGEDDDDDNNDDFDNDHGPTPTPIGKRGPREYDAITLPYPARDDDDNGKQHDEDRDVLMVVEVKPVKSSVQLAQGPITKAVDNIAKDEAVNENMEAVVTASSVNPKRTKTTTDDPETRDIKVMRWRAPNPHDIYNHNPKLMSLRACRDHAKKN